MASNRSCKPRFRARVIAVLLMLVPLAGCLKHELSAGLTEKESQEMIVVLKESGLDATRVLSAKEREAPSWSVFVKGGDQNLVLAWRVLQENGLPRDKVKGLDEAFSNQGMIPTSSEERARMLIGLSGEISRTLRSMAGVADARVHVVLPENSPLVDRAQWAPPSAAVLLKYRGSQSPLSEDEVKKLVSKGVEGLKPEDIAVVMKRVVANQQASRDVQWYAGNQELTVAALALLLLTAIAALSLLARVKQLRWQLERAQQALMAGKGAQ